MEEALIKKAMLLGILAVVFLAAADTREAAACDFCRFGRCKEATCGRGSENCQDGEKCSRGDCERQCTTSGTDCTKDDGCRGSNALESTCRFARVQSINGTSLPSWLNTAPAKTAAEARRTGPNDGKTQPRSLPSGGGTGR